MSINRYLPWILLSLIIGLHFLFLLNLFAPAIVTPDANGYWAQGSLLFTRGRTWFKPESPLQYIGMHWLPTGSGRYYSRYPPGLSVIVGLVYRLFGYKASTLINPILTEFSLVGLYLFLRHTLGKWWGLAGITALAVNPVFNQQALWCFSHMAVTCFLVWGLVFLLRWAEDGRLWEAFLTGLLFGCISTIRYPEALFGLGVAAFMLLYRHDRKEVWSHYLMVAIGAALPLIPLLIRNQMAFGAFYRTGYSLSGEQTAFGWGYLKAHLIPYVRELLGGGMGAFLPLGLIGMTMMLWDGRRRRLGTLLILLIVPSTLLYMAYYWGPGMRFLLPTFICYITAGLWLMARLMEGKPTSLRFSVIGLILLFQLIWGWYGEINELKGLKRQREILARITDELERRTECGDVIIADSLVLQHLDFVRGWKLIDRGYLSAISQPFARWVGPIGRGRNGLAQGSRGKRLEEILGRYAEFDPQERWLRIKEDILEWAGKHRVYYVGDERGIEDVEWAIGGAFEVVARIPVPGFESREMPKGKRLPGGPNPPRFRPPFAAWQGPPPPRIDGPPGRERFPSHTAELVIAEWR